LAVTRWPWFFVRPVSTWKYTTIIFGKTLSILNGWRLSAKGTGLWLRAASERQRWIDGQAAEGRGAELGKRSINKRGRFRVSQC